jgi:hypothetical protein
MLCLFTVACKAMIPKNPVVVEKQHEPEYAWVEIVPIPVASSEAISHVLIPYFIYDNENWVLVIEGIHKNK